MTGNLRSILAMLAAMGCFSLMDAVLKTLAGSYPVLQVAALRGLASLPLVCAYVLWRREVHQLLRVRWPLHLLRGVLSVVTASLFFYAVTHLPLAIVTALAGSPTPTLAAGRKPSAVLSLKMVRPPSSEAWKCSTF